MCKGISCISAYELDISVHMNYKCICIRQKSAQELDV
jgi:hypothetical protein